MTTISDHLIRKHSGEYDPEVVTRLSLVKQSLTEISNLDRCSSLTYLDLSNNDISLIMGLDHIESLKRLDLSCNKIEILGSGLSANVNLISLNLKGNLIRDMNQLGGLASLEKLESLHLRDESGKDANPVCADEGYVGYVQKTLKSLTLLDGGHLLLVDCVSDMKERMEAIKPDEDSAKTPPNEPWLGEGVDLELGALDKLEVDENATMSTKNLKTNPNFAVLDDTIQSISDMVQMDGSHLLRKAQSALSKSQTL